MFSDPANAVRQDPRTRSVERSLEAARARSTERYERLVAAARDFANERESSAFTVQEVARRAGSSLKGFYRCFAGKDELLIALLAEDSRLGATILDERVRAQEDLLAGLRVAVTALFELATLPGATGYARVLLREERRLAELHYEELRDALSPIADVIARAVGDAVSAQLACSANPVRDADTVFALVLDGLDDVTLGRRDPAEHSEYLWQFVAGALGVPPTVRIELQEHR
jgi:AcrR family transcriptional regulator